jgi:hypothetical protein
MFRVGKFNILDVILDELLSSDIGTLENGIKLFRNKDGRIRQRDRVDYGRGPKKQKPSDPENINFLLQSINHPNVNESSSHQGKDFPKKFRTPFPVFLKIVELCKGKGGKLFDYGSRDVSGNPIIERI